MGDRCFVPCRMRRSLCRDRGSKKKRINVYSSRELLYIVLLVPIARE